MNKRTVKGLVCVCVAAAFVSGCKRAEPGLPQGRFTLKLAGMTPVPVVLEKDSLCRDVLMSGFVELKKNHSFSSSFTIGKACGKAKPQFQTTGVQNGQYRMTGDTASMFDDFGRFSGTFYARGRDTLFAHGERWDLVYVRE